MGYYVNVVAKPGCEDQINELWCEAFDEDYLIMTEDRIAREIKALQTNPSMAHLSWVKTESDWTDVFPILARGLGQVFLDPDEGDIIEDPGVYESYAALRAKVLWLQSNRMLFAEIRNLQDAVIALELDYDFDGYENGRAVIYDAPDFARLPVEPKNSVYQRSLEMGNPSLWECFISWRDDPGVETWEALKSHSIPTGQIMGDTIWSLCEKMHAQRTGEPLTLAGVYQNGRVPPMTDVVRAVLTKASRPGAAEM